MGDDIEKLIRPTSGAEMEAVGVVMIGENREDSTIINDDDLVVGYKKFSSKIVGTEQNRQNQRNHHDGHNHLPQPKQDRPQTPPASSSPPPPPPPNPPQNDQTIGDLFLTALYDLWNLITGNTHNPEDKLKFLSDTEIDKLSIFQGDSTAFFAAIEKYCKSPLSEGKKSQIESLLDDNDCVYWERRCRTLMTPTILQSPLMKQLDGYRAKLRAYLGSWSPYQEHCSQNIYLLDDQVTAHRIPVVNHTDSIRGKLGFCKGTHAWDLRITGELGTHCSIGIALEDAPLQSSVGYISMIGDDNVSWGWDIVWGNTSHGGRIVGNYPAKYIYDYTPGDIIRIILDCEKRELSFAVNEMYFGVAFKDLPGGVKFYPSAGLVYGNQEVSLIYLGKPPPFREDVEFNENTTTTNNN